MRHVFGQFPSVLVQIYSKRTILVYPNQVQVIEFIYTFLAQVQFYIMGTLFTNEYFFKWQALTLLHNAHMHTLALALAHAHTHTYT